MHEYGIVDQLIEGFLETQAALRLPAVRLVRVRYGPGLTAASVRQAFLIQSAGTKLAKARLELAPKPLAIACPCGTTLSPYPDEPARGADRDHDHDHGLPYLSCGCCGAVHAIPHFNTLELTHAE